MNGKIQNSPIRIGNSQIRPPRNLQPHHIRHLVSGTLVFMLGIAANEAIMHLRHHWPRKVRWSATEMQNDYVPQTGLPPQHIPVEVGMCEDGSFVWRLSKSQSQSKSQSTASGGSGAIKIGEQSKIE